MRKDDAKPVTLNKDVKYPLVMLDILYGVIIYEDMLGKFQQLKYAYNAIIDMANFPKLVPDE